MLSSWLAKFWILAISVLFESYLCTVVCANHILHHSTKLWFVCSLWPFPKTLSSAVLLFVTDWWTFSAQFHALWKICIWQWDSAYYLISCCLFIFVYFRSLHCPTWLFHLCCCHQHSIQCVWSSSYHHNNPSGAVESQIKATIQGEIWTPVLNTLLHEGFYHQIKVNNEYAVGGAFQT